jgi:16S rRNA (uracil1498-N3)-methyltransferase
MHLFYVPELTPTTKSIYLSEDESKHACRVLRLKMNDEVSLLDGVGGVYHARIEEDNPKKCLLQIITVTQETQPAHEVHIAIAPTKNMDRIEWFVEKATEIGMTELTLIICDHSERKIVKTERLEKILISAMKQSKRTFIPKLNAVVTFSEFMKQHTQGALAHCEEGEKKSLQTVYKASNYPILIGPEGDFSSKEIAAAKTNGFDFVVLGNTRLRTETAGLYACVQAKMLGDA